MGKNFSKNFHLPQQKDRLSCWVLLTRELFLPNEVSASRCIATQETIRISKDGSKTSKDNQDWHELLELIQIALIAPQYLIFAFGLIFLKFCWDRKDKLIKRTPSAAQELPLVPVRTSSAQRPARRTVYLDV